jgi:hypothetical protein
VERKAEVMAMFAVEKRKETMWKEGAYDCEGDESLDNAGKI